jgi:hypothetical protein
MPNPIKYNTNTESNALNKGDFWIGTGDVDKGPTSTTGFYNGITPPSGGYTVYVNKASGGPSIQVASSDAELIRITNTIAGTSYTTINECLNYFAGQDDKVCFNRDYEDIVTDGLVLNIDPGFIPSYPKNGTTGYNISTNTNNGTLINGTTFDSADGGSFVFDGSDDYIELPYNSYWNANVFGTATNFTLECWYKPDLFKNWDTIIEKSSNPGYYSESEGPAIWTNSSSIQGVFSSGVYGNPAGSTVIISYPTTTLKWYHIAFTGDGTTLRLYVDGVQRTTGIIGSRTVAVSNGNVGPRFGRRAYMDGKLGPTRFYTRNLTSTEILQNYNAQKSRFGL